MKNSAQNIDTPEDDIPESESAAAAEKTMDTKEGRKAIADDYNAVLEGLRGKYDEEEAMRRFDEFMKSEGFEKVEPTPRTALNLFGLSNGLQGNASTDQTSRFGNPVVSIRSADPGQDLTSVIRNNRITDGTGERSNLNLHSTLNSLFLDGKNEYSARTTATFAAEYSDDVLAGIESFSNRNIDKLQGEVGFDLAEKMNQHSMRRYGSAGQVSAVSVNKDLAATTNDILQRAGMELGAGENIEIHFSMDENGNIAGLFSYDEKVNTALNNAVKRDPDILQAFVAEYNSVGTDLENLNGQYSGAGSSVDYMHMGRSFILSGDDPSAMIMADQVGVKSTGYTYQKVVSDSFDPNADTMNTSSRGAVTDELADKVAEAARNGTTVESTITQDEYDARKSESGNSLWDRMRERGIPILFGDQADGKSDFYVDPEMVRRQMEAVAEGKDPTVIMAIAEEYDTNNEYKRPEAPEAIDSADSIISYDDGKNNVRELTLSAIMDMLNSQRRANSGGFGLFTPWS